MLEEPEHLTWYHHGARWADKFEHVVGVVHTNYLDYAAREEGGALKAAALKFLNGAVVRAHTHKVVKLSDAVQPLPRSVTEFVHGVPQAFLEVGRRKGRAVRRAMRSGGGTASRGATDDDESGESDGGDLPGSDPLPRIRLPWQPRKTSPPPPPPASDAFGRGAYFIGKALWAKGYTELLDLLEEDAREAERLKKLKRSLPPLLLANRGVASLFGISPDTEDDEDDEGEDPAAAAVPPRRRRRVLPHLGGGTGVDRKKKKKKASCCSPPVVDCFGTGPDLADLRSSASTRNLPVRFHGAADHLSPSLHDYRVLVNPSTSDVVATTTAEALAMGKWVLVADLPCNAFFKLRFRNCLTYRTPREFSRGLRTALSRDPHPVSSDEAAALSWEAATQRFLDACSLAPGERAASTSLSAAADRALYTAHNALTGVEPFREAAGAGRGTRDAPESLEGWQPEVALGKGLFDRKN